MPSKPVKQQKQKKGQKGNAEKKWIKKETDKAHFYRERWPGQWKAWNQGKWDLQKEREVFGLKKKWLRESAETFPKYLQSWVQERDWIHFTGQTKSQVKSQETKFHRL